MKFVTVDAKQRCSGHRWTVNAGIVTYRQGLLGGWVSLVGVGTVYRLDGL